MYNINLQDIITLTNYIYAFPIWGNYSARHLNIQIFQNEIGINNNN